MSGNSTSVSSISETDIANNILVTQVDQIYKQTPITIIGPVFGAGITIAILKDYVPLINLVSWLALVLFSYGLLIKPWWDYKKTGINTNNAKQLADKYIRIGWLACICWGSVSFFLFSNDSLSAQILLAMSVMVGLSAIMSSTIIYSRLFYTVLAMSAQLIIRFVYAGEQIHYIIALGCFGITLMFFFLHINMNKSVINSLKLQYLNESLAADLNIQKQRADKANLDKSKFLAAVSHDLRQPLHAHGLFFGDLQNRISSQANCKTLIEKMNLSLNAINELFNTLLDLSKLEAGAIKPDIQSFYLHDLIKPIEQEFNVKCTHAKVEFTSVKSNCIVRSDKILLGRIIRNLLENALKHNPEGKILLGCRRKKNDLCIQILDNGKGISEVDQKYIFDEYYQIKNNKKNGLGYGLGLSVVKEQCRLLNHSIALSSTQGDGSVFSITVPLSDASSITKQDNSLNVLFTDEIKDLNVIVIDNDPAILDAMSGVLTSWNCHAIIGASVSDIEHQLVDDIIPDVIISDYKLDNDETGLTAVHQLRKLLQKDIPAAIITGDSSELDIVELRKHKLPLLQKPVNIAKLRTLLRQLKGKTRTSSTNLPVVH